MKLDPDRIDQAVLALLFLGLHEGSRAWKSFDWGFETKRALYQAMICRLGDDGIPRENWGLAGGQVGSEVDPGYQVER
ncbi:hypothetical protein J2W49_001738 [Hydrogenophaga palleronii]|uniref:DUF6429 domain-containing protein n=1 Tax=Hydrogenophaga palleronii TaxID=65655 RepID=A0ABU1WKK9_9BURK|nr:hypothetical protein [Hydrogenophaga palleronii]MDR7149783.1 hypothetical protein [Hydrogenophaga palleronii]